MAPLAHRLSMRGSWLFSKAPLAPNKPPPAVARIPFLPPEIIECIISHLADSATLKSCSLVSTTFLPPSQRFLFTHVILRMTTKGVNPFTTFFHSTCAKSQQILVLITSLNIIDFAEGGQSWLARDKRVVPSILASAPNLTHLGLYSEAPELSAGIQDALTGVYGTCALTSLSLRGMSVDLMEILRRCLFLSELALRDIELVSNVDTTCSPVPVGAPGTTIDLPVFSAAPIHHRTPTQASTSFQLQATISQLVLQLTRSTSSRIVDQLIHSPIWASLAGSLHILELDLVHFRYGRELQRLLDATSNTVRELHIHTPDVESLSFHIPPNTTDVLFHFKMVSHPNPSFVDIFHPFNRLHRHAHVSKGISDVRLHIDIRTPHALFDRPPWEWAFLDELMMCVRKVVWVVVTLVGQGEMMMEMKDAFAQHLHEYLPRATQKGILKVKVVG